MPEPEIPKILGVAGICRPPDLNGRLFLTIPLMGAMENKAYVADGHLTLEITGYVSRVIERLIQQARERGI